MFAVAMSLAPSALLVPDLASLLVMTGFKEVFVFVRQTQVNRIGKKLVLVLGREMRGLIITAMEIIWNIVHADLVLALRIHGIAQRMVEYVA